MVAKHLSVHAEALPEAITSDFEAAARDISGQPRDALDWQTTRRRSNSGSHSELLEPPNQHEGVLAVCVVARRGLPVDEPVLSIERACALVALADFEFDRPRSSFAEDIERAFEQRRADSSTPELGVNSEVLDMSEWPAVIRHVVGDHVADHFARIGHQKARRVEKPLERAVGPRLGERGFLDAEHREQVGPNGLAGPHGRGVGGRRGH